MCLCVFKSSVVQSSRICSLKNLVCVCVEPPYTPLNFAIVLSFSLTILTCVQNFFSPKKNEEKSCAVSLVKRGDRNRGRTKKVRLPRSVFSQSRLRSISTRRKTGRTKKSSEFSEFSPHCLFLVLSVPLWFVFLFAPLFAMSCLQVPAMKFELRSRCAK